MGVDVSVFLFDVRTYEQELLPAYRAFIQRADAIPLAFMLENAISAAHADAADSDVLTRPTDVYEEYANILKGEAYYGSHRDEPSEYSLKRTSPEDLRVFVDRSVAPALMRLLCVPIQVSFSPEQQLSSPALTRYLYEHSRWIEDYLTFAREPRGQTPEIKLGEWNRLFSDEEVTTFEHELARIPVPSDPEIIDEFNNLCAIVHASLKTERLGVLLCVS